MPLRVISLSSINTKGIVISPAPSLWVGVGDGDPYTADPGHGEPSDLDTKPSGFILSVGLEANMIMKPIQHIEHMQTKDNQANARRAEQATDNWMDKSTYEFAAISVLAPLESSRRFLSFYEVL